METLQYVFNGVLWAALWLGIGFTLGKGNRMLDQLTTSMRNVEAEVHDIKGRIEELDER